MATQSSDEERKSKLQELLLSGETDLDLYDGLLADNAVGDILRISLAHNGKTTNGATTSSTCWSNMASDSMRYNDYARLHPRGLSDRIERP